MTPRFLLTLTVVLAAAVMPAGLSAQGAPRPAEPSWKAELPAAPDAAMAWDARLWVLTLGAEGLEVRSRGHTPEGFEAPEAPVDPWTTVSASYESLGGVRPDFVRGVRGRWVIGAAATRSLWVTAPDLAELRLPQPPKPNTAIPFDRLDDAETEGGFLYVLGAAGPDPQVAWTRLEGFGPDSKWSRDVPVPDGRTAAAATAVGTRLFVIGGEIPIEDEVILPREAFSCDLGETGQPSSWTLLATSLPRGLGRCRLAESHGVLVATGDNPLASSGGRLNRMVIALATQRAGGYLSPWREALLEVPALQGVLLVADRHNHQMVILGGSAAAGAPVQRTAWGLGLPKTPAYLASKASPEAAAEGYLPASPRTPLVDFRAARNRAPAEDRHIVVFLLGEDEASKGMRRLLERNRHVETMLRDCLAAEPSPGDLAEVRQLLGEPATIPALGLLSANGAVLAVHEGALDQAGMAGFLAPLWNP